MSSLDVSLDTLTAKRTRGGAASGRYPRRGAGAVRAAGARDSGSPYKRPAGGRGDAAIRNRVYVHNLDWSVTWQELKDHMRSAGDVTRADVLQKPDGKSKGCGIVEYATARDAAEAIRSLNDTELNGRPILVREDREDRGVGSAGSARGGAGGSVAGRRLYIGNLPFHLTWQGLKDAFKHFGDVAYANVELMEDGRSKGWGIVEFATVGAARAALESNVSLDGREVEVREDKYAGGSGGGGARGGAGGGRSAAPVIVRAGGGGGGGGDVDTVPGAKVYIGNLPWTVTWQNLKDEFSKVGTVVHADVAMNKDGRSKGFGFITFTNAADAQRAVATYSGASMDGRAIEIHVDKKTADGAFE